LNTLAELPPSTSLSLTGPYRVTIEEFEALPVTAMQLEARLLIYTLEAEIDRLAREGAEVLTPTSLEPKHHFSKGIYTRELTMPAGVLVVGKRHAQEHIVMVTRGRCTVFTERGQEEVTAPLTFVSPAGEKRVFLVHEDTTLITVHRTDATSLDEVERDLILTDPNPLLINSPDAQGREK
jgi:quercetin dioxygenase-like cupin family protein